MLHILKKIILDLKQKTRSNNGVFFEFNRWITLKDSKGDILDFNAFHIKNFLYELHITTPDNNILIYNGMSQKTVYNRLNWHFFNSNHIEIREAKNVTVIIREHLNFCQDKNHIHYLEDKNLFNICEKELKILHKWNESYDRYRNPLDYHSNELRHIINKKFNNWEYYRLMERNNV